MNAFGLDKTNSVNIVNVGEQLKCKNNQVNGRFPRGSNPNYPEKPPITCQKIGTRFFRFLFGALSPRGF